jgi:hypothetical protein
MDNHENRLNRHDRRRQARLSDFNLGELDLIPASQMAERLRGDPWIDLELDEWVRSDPFCIACLVEFEHLPPLWVAARAAHERLPIVGLCDRCCDAGSPAVVIDRIVAGFRRAGLSIKSARRAGSFVSQGGSA